MKHQPNIEGTWYAVVGVLRWGMKLMIYRYLALLTLVTVGGFAGFGNSRAQSAPDDGTLVGSRPY